MASGRARSNETFSTASVSPEKRFRAFRRAGILSMHGPHHVAQRFIKTCCPLNPEGSKVRVESRSPCISKYGTALPSSTGRIVSEGAAD